MGRDFVSPDDVKQVAPAALAHRIVLAHGVDVRGGWRGGRRDRRHGRVAASRDVTREPAPRRRRRTGPGRADAHVDRAVHAGRVRRRGGRGVGRAERRRGRRVRVHAVRRRDHLADRRARPASSVDGVDAGRRDGRRAPRRCTCSCTGRAPRVEVRVLDPPGEWWVTASPADGVIPRVAARRGVFRARAHRAAHVGAARRLRPHARRARRPAGRAGGRAAARRRSRRAAPCRERPHDGAIVDRVAARPRRRRHRARGAARTCRATRRGSCTGRRARGAATLVVREHEPPAAIGVALVVDLNGAPRRRRGRPRAAPRASAARRSPRAASVWCCTSEADGPVSARSSPTRAMLGRRLARAPWPASPAAPPDGLAGRGRCARERRAEPRRSAQPSRRCRRSPGSPWRDRRDPGRDRARRGRRDRRRAASDLPLALGALAGAAAALLGVLALPSLPTRRVVVVLLGVGGLGALRHASFAGADTSALLVCWAGATLVALVLVDRADAGAGAAAPAAARRCRAARARSPRVAIAIAVIVGGGGGRARSDDHRPPRPPRVAGPRPVVRRRDRRAVVAARDRPARHDAAAPALRPGRVHGRRAARRLLAGRDVRRVGRAARGRSPTADRRRSSRDGDTVAGRARPERRRARSAARRCARRSTSRPAFSNVVFAAPSPRRGRDRQGRSRTAPTAPLTRRHGGFGKGATYTVDEPQRARRPRRCCARPTRRRCPTAIARPVRGRPVDTTERVQRAGARRSPRRPRRPTTRSARSRRGSARHCSTRSTRRSSPHGRRRRRRLLVPQSRVGWCEQVASSLVVHGAQRRDPGPARDRLRARRARRAHRPVRRARARRARVGRDLLPRRRLAAASIPTASVPLAGDASRERLVARRPRGTTRSRSACSRPRSCCSRSARPTLRRAVAGAARAPARVVGGAHARPAGTHRPQGRAGPGAGGDAPRVRARARRAPARRPASRTVGDALDADGVLGARRVADPRACDADAVLSSLRP